MTAEHDEVSQGGRSDWRGILTGILLISLIGAIGQFVHSDFVDLGLSKLLYANTVGVLLGGYLALWANRSVTEQQERARRRAERRKRWERREQALGALSEVIAHNRSELEDVLNALDPHKMDPVFSTADPRAFDPILNRAVETVDDFELLQRSSTFRHQLDEFNRMAEAQLELILLPSLHPRPGALPDAEAQKIDTLRKKLIKKANRFGSRLVNEAEELAKEVEKARQNTRE